MTTIEIFEPPLCCPTGVCGAEVDQALVDFAADVEWAKHKGMTIRRWNLLRQPLAFAENPKVKAFLERSGQEALPFFLGGRLPRRSATACSERTRPTWPIAGPDPLLDRRWTRAPRGRRR
ncbi:arsenite efflux transporter metallochaperone ArsD [Methylacidimicrobium sp. AP8]|uniref:arsenite efflux transporter metallochaperone ArsD n=1 Tax=Methylacidimicrobium sp. AP8 TaxID=2730359 RepID=UPI00351C6304